MRNPFRKKKPAPQPAPVKYEDAESLRDRMRLAETAASTAKAQKEEAEKAATFVIPGVIAVSLETKEGKNVTVCGVARDYYRGGPYHYDTFVPMLTTDAEMIRLRDWLDERYRKIKDSHASP